MKHVCSILTVRLLVSTAMLHADAAGHERVFNVRAFGATGDGSTLDTKFIQAAIAACHASGGGRGQSARRLAFGTIREARHRARIVAALGDARLRLHHAALDVELSYLCFNTLVIDPPDKSFAESYQRVASGRIARWKSGDATVGE